MLSAGGEEETAQSRALKEGALTVGVWQPLAVAQIIGYLQAVCRFLYGDKIKIQKTSEVLKSISLPLMAEALEADEKESEALELLEAVKRLKAKKDRKNG